jgi:hypothetical protein
VGAFHHTGTLRSSYAGVAGHVTRIDDGWLPAHSGNTTVMGTLLRRTVDGDEVLAEWSASDASAVRAAERMYRHWLEQDYEAVQSDGTYFEPVVDDAFPADAEQVIVSTGMGGG